MFRGAWKVGAILLSLSVLYGDEGIEHRIKDSQLREAEREKTGA